MDGGSGNDAIHDFEQGAGTTGDLLDVSGYGYTAFDQLNIGQYIPTQAYVCFGGSGIVYVSEVTALAADDFIFA